MVTDNPNKSRHQLSQLEDEIDKLRRERDEQAALVAQLREHCHQAGSVTVSALKNYQRKPNGASPHPDGEPGPATILAPHDPVERLAKSRTAHVWRRKHLRVVETG